MKIEVYRIPSEGLSLCEEIDPRKLDLAIDNINFRKGIKVRADVLRTYNVVSLSLNIEAEIYGNCCRCLEEYNIDFKSNLALNYPIEKADQVIDLDPEIREEIIINYPVKPLCKADCLGLCPRCGKNLNEGGCNCGST
jgi:uncharacterized protein